MIKQGLTESEREIKYLLDLYEENVTIFSDNSVVDKNYTAGHRKSSWDSAERIEIMPVN